MKGKRRTPLPRSQTRKRKPRSKPAPPRPNGETERLAVRRRDAMKYRLAGASYRAIAEKLTEERAAEGHLTRRLFGDMLRRIWALPVPAG